ncbi:PEP/pyruvate-binding domain-containing protein, partial [Elusimicrobiota bacterium]
MNNKLKQLEKQKHAKIDVDNRYIIPLEEVDEDYIKLVGGKNAKLGMLMQAKYETFKKLKEGLGALGMEMKVPGGFAVTTTAYLAYLEQQGLKDMINEIANSEKTAKVKSQEIKRLIKRNGLKVSEGAVGQRLGKIILDAFKKYKSDTDAMWFAIRSAALQEDTEKAAYAGMGSTHLYVGEEDLLEKMTDVEASVWNERAIIYRDENKVDPSEVRQAVVVQEMVDSEVAGVMYTQDPVTGNPGRVVINTSYGLGETVVSGIVNPDQYELSKETGEEVKEAVIGTKRIRIVGDPEKGGTKIEYVDIKARRQRSLTTAQTKALAMIAEALEEFYGSPQDIEFGIKGNTVYILQSRPIAVKPKKEIKVAEEEPVSALHTGNIIDIIKMLAAFPIPYLKVFNNLELSGSSDEFVKSLIEGNIEELEKIGLDKVLTALLRVTYPRHYDEKQVEMPQTKALIESLFKEKLLKEYSLENVKKVEVFITDKLFYDESGKTSLVAPFFYNKKYDTWEFHINRDLVDVIMLSSGKKDLLHEALVDRELLIQQFRQEGLSFDEAHKFYTEHYLTTRRPSELTAKRSLHKELMNLSENILEMHRTQYSPIIDNAIKEINSIYEEYSPYIIKPEQVHVVQSLPEGMRKEGPATWTGTGDVYIRQDYINEVMKSSGLEMSDVRVKALLKSVITSLFYIEYCGFAAWQKSNREERGKQELVDRKLVELQQLTEDYGFDLNYLSLEDMYENVQFYINTLRRESTKKLIKAFGLRITTYLNKQIYNLYRIKLPTLLPSKIFFISNLANEGYNHFALGLGKLEGDLNDVHYKHFIKKLWKSGLSGFIKDMISRSTKIFRHRSGESTERIRNIVNGFNKLVNANFAALELLFEANMTRKTAETILGHLEVMLDEYGYLTDVLPPGFVLQRKVKTLLNDHFTNIKSELTESMSAYGPQEVLPDEIARSIKEFRSSYKMHGIRSVHELINYLHQDSFNLLDKISNNFDEEMFQTLTPNISIVDVDDRPLTDGKGNITNPILRAILGWPVGPGDCKLIFKENTLWSHINIGDHSAGIYIDPSPPDEGGVLKITYAEGERNMNPPWRRIRVEYVKRVFENLGMKADIIGDYEFVSAVLDKDSGVKTGKELIDAFYTATSAINSSRSLDIAVEDGVKEHGGNILEKARELADIFVAENRFPFQSDGMISYENYIEYSSTGKEYRWKTLKAEINEILRSIDLPVIPENIEIIGKKIIDEYFNKPVKLGLARGELIMRPDKIDRNHKHLPRRLTAISNYIEKNEESMLQAGTVVRQLDGHIEFETIGGIGRYLVQRGSIETADGLLDIYALRDIDTNAVKYGQVIEINMNIEDLRYIRNIMTPAAIHRALDRERYETGPPQEITKAERELAKQKLHAQPYAEILGDTVRGIASSPGTGLPVTGIATYWKDHTKEQGKVLIAPYTEPNDVKAIKESKAVLTTGGGTLAHAGITTREFGIPSAIISSARWEGKGEYKHIVLDHVIPKNYKKTEKGIWISNESETKEIHIKEGDIITVDGLTGAVIPVSSEYQDEIRQAYVLMERIKAGLPKKGIKKVLMGRAYPTKLVNKFKELGRMLKKTKNFELI